MVYYDKLKQGGILWEIILKRSFGMKYFKTNINYAKFIIGRLLFKKKLGKLIYKNVNRSWYQMVVNFF